MLAQVGRWPGRLGQPLPGPDRRERLGLGPVVAERDQARLVHDAVVDALQPVVEEADQLVVPVDMWRRVGLVGRVMDPVADERLARRVRAALEHSQRGVDVLVHPAADQEHRRREAVVAGREGTLPPVRPIVLLAEPLEEPDRGVLEAVEPFRCPGGAAVLGARRHRVHPDHAHGVLRQLGDRGAAAEVMDVVGVAVVGRHHRDDRGEVRRVEERDLDRGEAAVRDPPHPDLAVAPRLRRQPLDGVEAVLGLACGVLVQGDSRRRARAPNVEPAQGEPARRQPLAAALVARRAPVVFAVGDHLEDRREDLWAGPVPERLREPQVGR